MRRAVTRHPARPRAGQGAGAARQGARAPPLPHAALPARLPADLRGAARRGAARRGAGGRSGVMTDGAGDRRPLVLVSNRGPVTFQDDGSVKRGGGGLVTALTGLASHREAVWIASAMSEADAQRAREAGGRPFNVSSPSGREYFVRLVESDPDAYDRFYNVFANPMLWFIQHYLWDPSTPPAIPPHEIGAFEFGYNVVNEDLARAVIDEVAGDREPVV